MTDTRPGMTAYRADVDGLRAVAVIAVVGSHAGVPGWGGGFVGVDIFFVISGFLITSLLLREAEASGRIDLWGFYARRVRRLLPALVVCLTGTLILGAFFLVRINGEQQGLARSAIAALLLNANHYFMGTSQGYFDLPSELQPLLHIWSLSLEEQYYLVWPAAISLLAWRSGSDGLRSRIFWVLAAVFGISLAACVRVTFLSPKMAFYLMPFRAWELAAGGLLALLPSRTPHARARRWGNVLGLIGLGMLAIAIVSFSAKTPFPGWAALLPVVGSVAVIEGNRLAPRGLAARLLSLRPVVFLGLVSYSWYLWHWPLLAIARSNQLGDHNLLRDTVLAGGIGLILAVASFRWVEVPIRHGDVLKRRGDKISVRLGLLATCATVMLAGSFGAWAKYSPRTDDEKRLSAAQADQPPTRPNCNNNLTEPPHLSSEACVQPPGSSKIDVLLWGDSAADHWMPALLEAAGVERHAVHQLSRDGCPPLLGFPIVHRLPGEAQRCQTFLGMARDEIRRLRVERGLKLVILSGLWATLPEASMGEALGRTLDHLTRLGLEVVIIAPTPILPYRAPECLLQGDPGRCVLTRAAYDKQTRGANEQIRLTARGRAGVRVVDPTPLLCNSRECPATRGNLVLYRDEYHLTAAASRTLASVMREALAEPANATVGGRLGGRTSDPVEKPPAVEGEGRLGKGAATRGGQ